MEIVVQKFGGTSVSTEDRRSMVIDKILKCKNIGKSIVVVVSAIGRKGEPYATDTLKELISSTCPGYSLKTLDLLMSCGEIISASILGATLEAMGQKVAVLSGAQAGILTDTVFGNAEILAIDENKILNYLKEDNIVIVTGFQGATETGETTTLGRGGSDTTAAALGVALKAECVEIYTDVDGIMTADPNLVAKAKIINELNYEEVFQMAEKGAQIIHPRAVEIAKKGNITLNVKNTMSSHPGTIVHYYQRQGEEVYSTRPNSQKLLTAITHKNHIAQVSVFVQDNLEIDSLLLSSMADADISIDMINFFIDKKVFTINEEQLPKIKKLMDGFNIEYSILDGCSKVTIIGSRITGIPGVMATIVTALARENIRIFQSSDSHATISCLVSRNDVNRAVNVLHDAFHLDI